MRQSFARSPTQHLSMWKAERWTGCAMRSHRCRPRRRWLQAARKTGQPSLAREHGELIARAVKAFGFNSPLAPVLDLGLPESEKVLATRCAGRDCGGSCGVCTRVSGRACGAGRGGLRETFSGAGRRDARLAFGDAKDSPHLEASCGRRIWSPTARCGTSCRW